MQLTDNHRDLLALALALYATEHDNKQMYNLPAFKPPNFLQLGP